MIKSSFFFSVMLVFCASCAGCLEIGRLEPGFQPLPHSAPVPQLGDVDPEGDQRRRDYAESFMRQVCLYAQVKDQFGHVVPFAPIRASCYRLGWGTSKGSLHACRADAEGRFSLVVAEPVTGSAIYIFMPGYTPYERNFDSIDETRFLAGPNKPAIIQVWKNIDNPPPQKSSYESSLLLPLSQEVDGYFYNIIDKALVTKNQPYDVEIRLTPGRDPREGKDNKEMQDIAVAHVQNIQIIFHDGVGNFVDGLPNPKLNRVPFDVDEGALWRPPGVLVKELEELESSFILNIARKNARKYVQFFMRNKSVFGALKFIPQGYDWKKMHYRMDIRGTINATGSPALYQREPNVKDTETMQQFPEIAPSP